ncbi:MAG: tetratricopeptide repeat protein [Myxococcota bacterium]
MAVSNPFLGPRPFERGASPYFFGRERESAELTSLIASRRCVFVYARSGAGKTSLMNAGVIPELERRDFLVLPVARVNGPGSPPDSVPNVYVQNAALWWHPEKKAAEVADWTIERAIAEHRARAPRRGCVVIFDQFEELTTYYPERWADRFDLFEQVAAALGVGRAELKEHAELLRDLGPAGWHRSEAKEALAELAARDPALPEALDAWKADNPARGSTPPVLEPYLDWRDTQDVRFVFTMREDYLARVESYSTALGSDMLSRHRMDPLRQKQARAAIAGPFEAAERPLDDEPVDDLVSRLATVRAAAKASDSMPRGELPTGEFIEPTHLQIACMTLWRDTLHDVGSVTTERVQQIDPVGNGLERFYEHAITHAAKKGSVGPLALRLWVEEHLITEGHTRGTVFRGETHSAKMKADAVEALDANGLIRPVKRAGASWYELTHDALIEPILRSNRAAERVAVAERSRWIMAAVALLVIAAPGIWIWVDARREETLASAQKELEDTKHELENQQSALENTAEELALTQREVVKKTGENDAAQLELERREGELNEIQGEVVRAHEALESVLEERGIARLGDECPVDYECTDAQKRRAKQKWNAARARADQYKTSQAISLHNEAIEACPSYAPAYNSLGAMGQRIVGNDELDQVRFDTAREYYECALKLNPDYAVAHSNLSGLLFHWSKTASPEEQEQLRERAGIEAQKAGDVRIAKDVLKQLQTPTRRAEAKQLWERGNRAHDAGNMDEAESLYQRSNDKDPSYAPALNSLGRISAESNDPQQAEQRFLAAISKDPESSQAWYNLVNVLIDQNKLEEAESRLLHAESHWPDDAAREQARDRLEEEKQRARVRRFHIAPL